MLYNVVLVSTVQQSESAICIHISPFLGFPSHLGHHRALSRVPVLYSRFSLVIYFMHSINSVYMSIPISQFIPSPLPPWYPCVCSLHLCLYFCFANKIIYTILHSYSFFKKKYLFIFGCAGSSLLCEGFL